MSVLAYVIYITLSLVDISFLVLMVLYAGGALIFPTGRALWKDSITHSG